MTTEQREQEQAVMDVVITPGAKVKTFGGWYRHDVVTLNGREIGRVQRRRRNGRFDTITLGLGTTCVLGQDVAWLVRQALEAK